MADYLFGVELYTPEEAQKIHDSFTGNQSGTVNSGYYDGQIGEENNRQSEVSQETADNNQGQTAQNYMMKERR